MMTTGWCTTFCSLFSFQIYSLKSRKQISVLWGKELYTTAKYIYMFLEEDAKDETIVVADGG